MLLWLLRIYSYFYFFIVLLQFNWLFLLLLPYFYFKLVLTYLFLHLLLLINSYFYFFVVLLLLTPNLSLTCCYFHCFSYSYLLFFLRNYSYFLNNSYFLVLHLPTHSLTLPFIYSYFFTLKSFFLNPIHYLSTVQFITLPLHVFIEVNEHRHHTFPSVFMSNYRDHTCCLPWHGLLTPSFHLFNLECGLPPALWSFAPPPPPLCASLA